MALATDCKTPGAVYHTSVTPNSVEVRVDLPSDVLKGISEIQAEGVELDLHNAIEMALAPYFSASMVQEARRRERVRKETLGR